jgi:hypothetical protein
MQIVKQRGFPRPLSSGQKHSFFGLDVERFAADETPRTHHTVASDVCTANALQNGNPSMRRHTAVAKNRLTRPHRSLETRGQSSPSRAENRGLLGVPTPHTRLDCWSLGVGWGTPTKSTNRNSFETSSPRVALHNPFLHPPPLRPLHWPLVLGGWRSPIGSKSCEASELAASYFTKCLLDKRRTLVVQFPSSDEAKTTLR